MRAGTLALALVALGGCGQILGIGDLRIGDAGPDEAHGTCDPSDGPSITISFPVVAIYDGADHRQAEALDDLGAALSDAIWRAKGRPVRSFSSSIDVGGPSLRAVEYQADFTVQGVTLCIPLLQEAV